MKKVVITLIAIALVLSLCACGDNVNDAFLDAGYTEVTTDEVASQVLTQLGSGYKELCTVHIYEKSRHRATILEFKYEEDLTKKLDDDIVFKNMVSAVRGRFVLLSGNDEAKKVFGTKK